MRKTFAKTVSAKTGLLLAAGALFAAMLTAPATAGFAQSADTNQLLSRINQLETQIQTLSRAFYRGETPPPSFTGGGMDAGSTSGFEARLAALESQQRSMTGQIERLGHDVAVLQEKLDKALADNDMRLRQLEGTGTAAPAATRPAADAVVSSRGSQVSDTLYAEDRGGQTLGTLSSSGSDPANSLYESGFNDIRETKYDVAEGKFKRFLALYPSHALAGNAQYWLAETHYVRGDFAQASRLFAQGYQNYPKGNKAADSLLKMGLSLAQTGKKEDACLSFLQLKKEFPSEQGTLIRRADQEMQKLGCN